MSAFTDLESLWHEHHAGMLRHAKRYVGPDYADDIVMDVYCNALKAMLNGRGYTESARGWLYRALHNRIVDHYRRRDATWGKDQELDPVVSDAPTPHECVERGMVGESVRAAIDTLPERQRDVATMRMGGYGYDEVAENVGCSHGAAKAIMTRAYASLREQLGEAA